MISDDMDVKIVYEQWCKIHANGSDNEENKSAFYAGFHLAFKRMMYLMEIVNTFTASDSDTPKN